MLKVVLDNKAVKFFPFTGKKIDPDLKRISDLGYPGFTPYFNHVYRSPLNWSWKWKGKGKFKRTRKCV